MLQQKKWVFTELVKDSNDPIQLIAYSMYKADKDDHARQCRSARKMSEAEVAQELHRYHEGIAVSQRKLNDYRDKARSSVEKLIIGVSEGLTFKYDKHIEALAKLHQKEISLLHASHARELKTVWASWTKRAARFTEHLNNTPWYIAKPKAFGLWLFSGIPGLLATVITTVMIVGVVSLFTTNSIQTTKKALFKGIDTLIPDRAVELPLLSEDKPNVTEPR